MQENININNKIIGPGAPTFVIAEISGNHGGEIKNAIKLIDEAKSIGADAVKLQTYTADTITLNSEKKILLYLQEMPGKILELYTVYILMLIHHGSGMKHFSITQKK